MLTNYETDTANLLQKPGASTPLYNTTSVDRWINIARGQLAGEYECIRYSGTISTVANQREYNFSGINTGVSATNGISGVLHVRAMRVGIGTGSKWLSPRPSSWFEIYALNNPNPQTGLPTTWSQFGQGGAPGGSGSGATGTFLLDPVPDAVYTLTCSCICFPIALVDDTTVEAIPYQWIDAVPFFAAYYALLSAQASARQGEAARMFEMYKMFGERARVQSNPDVNRWQSLQAADPTTVAKLGLKSGGGAG